MSWRDRVNAALAEPAAPPPPPPPPTARERYQARIAELTADFMMSEDWARAVAAVEQMPPPDVASAERWAEIVSDSTAFVSRWHEHLTGWSVTDAFGFEPDGAPDQLGFVLRIAGGSALIMDDGEAVIRRADGARDYFRPGTVPAETPPLWKIGKRL